MFSNCKRLCRMPRPLLILVILGANPILPPEILPLNGSAPRNVRVLKMLMQDNRDDSRLLEIAQKYGIGSRTRQRLRPSRKHPLSNRLNRLFLHRIRPHRLPLASIIRHLVMFHTVVTHLQSPAARRTLPAPIIGSRVRHRHRLSKRLLLVLQTGHFLSRKNLKTIPAPRQKMELLGRSGKVEIRLIMSIVWVPHRRPRLTSVPKGDTTTITHMGAG